MLEEAGFVVSVIDGDTMPEVIMPVVGPADYDSNKLFVCEKQWSVARNCLLCAKVTER